MKKLRTNALIFTFLLLISGAQGCDFLRKVAGRPTADRLEAEYRGKKALEQAAKDSLKAREERENQRQLFLADSLAGSDAVKSLGIKSSGFSRFGEPLEEVPYRYCLIVGVFRQDTTASMALQRASVAGFKPFLIRFDDNAKAVVMAASDSYVELAASAEMAVRMNACPSDAWIYCR